MLEIVLVILSVIWLGLAVWAIFLGITAMKLSRQIANNIKESKKIIEAALAKLEGKE